MKQWDSLTQTGKARRLRVLAMNALEAYDVTPTTVALVGGFTNMIFRVEAHDRRLAIRIDYQEDHPDESVEVELAWLFALNRDTDLDVCRVVPTRDGASSVYARAEGVPGDRRCVLFEWIPGQPLAKRLTPDNYASLGRIAARLHRHGAGFTPPHRPMAWNKVFYWPEHFDPVVIFDATYAHLVTPHRRHILERAIEIVQPAFDALDPEAAQIIHADLHPWNVHVHRQGMTVFDFEDVAWAHPTQDVAITLFYKRNEPQYPDLRAAFEDGYRSVAPWPVTYEGELERFMAARTIMLMNFVLNTDGDPAGYFDTAFPRLERFATTWGT